MAHADPALRRSTALAMQSLAHWAADPASRTLPEAIRSRAALILMDDLGAMVAGFGEPQLRAATAQFVRAAGIAEASVFAPATPRLDRANAAAANGMAAAWCELDEGFRDAPCHAGAYILPALLAEAEAGGASTAEMLSALALAYEITVRLALAFPFPAMTVHPHAAFAPIGAAAGIGLLRRQDGDTLLGAIAGAASMAFAGPFQHAMDGALVRNAWTAAGAWIGIKAADWAEIGITGLAETAFDVFAVSFATGCRPEILAADLGTSWAMQAGYHKIFACCQYAHSTVEASLALHARLQAADHPAAIEEIVVHTHPRAMALTAVEPASVLAAKFSIPHAAAASAVFGTGSARAFSASAMEDPAVAALRRKVRIAPFTPLAAAPHDRPARVAWRFADGTEWSETCLTAQGGADRPFETAALDAKFAEIAAPVFPAMLPVLHAIREGERAAMARPWAKAVAMMTEGARA